MGFTEYDDDNLLFVDAGDSPIRCPTCVLLCILKTCRKGRNQGRKFYWCERTVRCPFFVYVF
ncbi:putative transcription factor GRF family [Helianthus annuus]|nr:putative transcription factor GRF family [Helianthus annuus]